MFTTYKWSISSGLAAAADCCVSIECFDFFFPVFGIRLHGFFFFFFMIGQELGSYHVLCCVKRFSQ